MIFGDSPEISRIRRIPLGPYGNNAYLIGDAKGNECFIVDAPPEPGRLLRQVKDAQVKGILLTHGHQDHIVGLEELRRVTRAPVGIHEADKDGLLNPPDFILEDGEVLRIGGAMITVLHTPGHTPGSICLLVERHLISGDTLFAGGPGRTWSPQGFRRILLSIEQKLLVLDDDVVVYPGHGETTTIGQTRREHSVFSSRTHPRDLHGQVQWLTA